MFTETRPLVGYLRISCAASAYESAYIGRHDFPKGLGEFLPGPDQHGRKKIVEFVYYDDIDPHAPDTGIVHFAGNQLS